MNAKRVGIVVVVLLTMACVSAQEKAVKHSLTALNAARTGFVAWDAETQRGIVASATSLEEGRAKLGAHRTKRERVVAAFNVAYAALALAALEPTTANLLEAALQARILYEAIKALKEGS